MASKTAYLFFYYSYLCSIDNLHNFVFRVHSNQPMLSRNIQFELPIFHTHLGANIRQGPVNLPACLWIVDGNQKRRPMQVHGEPVLQDRSANHKAKSVKCLDLMCRFLLLFL